MIPSLTTIRKGAPVMAAVIGVAASFMAPIASADALPNGLTVDCKPDSDVHVTCVIGGCPRVNGDYVVDAVHVMLNGGKQDEYAFKCINGATARYGFDVYAATVDDTIGVQGCRKNATSADWCGPWADYHYKAAPKAAPAVPAPAPQQQAPPQQQQAPAAPPAAAPVTNAIQLSFGQPQITLVPPSASITATISNSSALPGKCTYDATPGNTHREFNVPANGSTPLTFNGLATGTNYHAKVSCTDSSGKQTQPIGTASQDVRF